MSEYIEVHLTHLRAAGMSDRTIYDRGRLLRHIDKALPHGLDRCAREEIETYLARKLRAESRAAYFGHLAGYWAHMCAGDEPYFTRNPMANLARPRVPRGVPDPVTEDELLWCLAHSAGMWPLVITLAAYAALRRGDIAALERADVTADRIHIRNGKGGVEAYVPTMPQVWALVEPLPAGRLLRRRDGREPTAGWLGVMAQYHFGMRLRRPDIHLHRFRHFCATRLTEDGVPTAVVAQVMRHRDLNTTARYIQVAERRVRTAMLGSLAGAGSDRPGQSPAGESSAA